MAPAGVNYRSLRPLGRAGYNRSPGWDRDLLTEAVCFSICPDIQSPMEKVELRAAKRGGQDGSPKGSVSIVLVELGWKGTQQRVCHL